MVCLCIYTAVALLLAATYWYLKRTFNYWKNQNVPSVPNPIPGFGHVWPLFTLKESILTFIERIYKQTDASVIGLYFLRTPTIVARDPEIVKCVLQTNFSNFRNNMIVLHEKTDPVLSKNPFFIRDPHMWKVSRQRTVSHLSGKKLGILFKFMNDVFLKVHQFVERKIKEKGDTTYECSLKEFFERYTGEFVANTAFGIEGDSFEDSPGPKAFTKVAKTLLEPTLINGLKQALIFYFPSLAKLFNVGFLAKNTDNYFRENLKRIIKERKEKGIVVNDYLQFCLDETSEDEFNNVIADIIIFFADSYETSSLTLTLLFYLLSKHQDIQDKLRKHIFEVVRENGGEINYETIKKMTYLDQVICESMRLMAPAGVLFKVCTEEIKLQGSDGLTCHLKPGHIVLIPISCLQTDNKHWPDPLNFNPDRFSPDSSANHHKYAYIPFGEGPRMCVGMRLGQTLVRLAAASLLTKFSIEPSSITKEPLERDNHTFLTYFKGGLWAKFKKLN